MTAGATNRAKPWIDSLVRARERVAGIREFVVEGTLNRMVGMTLEAVGCEAAVGGRCLIDTAEGKQVEAEVVGFSNDKLFLMPTGDIRGIMPGARVIPTHSASEVSVGEELLGRVLDGAGRPLDGAGELRCTDTVSLTGEPLNPLMRRAIRDPLDVGVRSINSLLTVGGGQRIGLFAGSGVGKSVLLGMMTRYTKADVTVVGLIGERGREVQDFVTNTLGPDGMRRAVVVATPADNPPLMRLHGAWLATAIAEYFRDRGLKVLLLLDSLTRFAQAQREIALAIGEPPATKGYPPSVFARLPQLVERAGNSDRGAGLHHGLLHRARGRRRSERPHCRCRPRDPRWPYRSLAAPGGERPVSGNRHRGLHQPGDAPDRDARSARSGDPIQAGVFDLSAESRPDHRRGLPSRAAIRASTWRSSSGPKCRNSCGRTCISRCRSPRATPISSNS